MNQIIQGAIPLTVPEQIALRSIPNVASYTRAEPGEVGPLLVSTTKGGQWKITGRKVERIG